MAVASFAPPAHTRIVNGEEIREPVLFGHVFTEWQFFLLFGPMTGLLWWGCYVAYGRIWPNKVTYEKAYPRAGGGTIYWQPTQPGGSSPMDYEPPHFNQFTTAKDFLLTNGPNPIRSMMLGAETWSEEFDDFQNRQTTWLEQAPEATLKEFVSEAEKIWAEPKGAAFKDVAPVLVTAMRLRGIPSKADLLALADRTEHEEISEILRDLD